MELSSSLNTLNWRGCLSPIVYFYLLCHTLIAHRSVDSFLGLLLCPIDLCVHFLFVCQHNAILIILVSFVVVIQSQRVGCDSGTNLHFSLSSYFELSNYSFSRNCFTLAKTKKKPISKSIISEEVHFRGRHFSLPQLEHWDTREEVQASPHLRGPATAYAPKCI